MKARKVSSNPARAQKLPKDSVKIITDVIMKNFKKFTKDKTVKIDGDIYMEEIVINIGFQNKDGIKQVNFSASTDHDMKKKNTMEQIYLAIDALGSMISQYAESEGDIELPDQWTEFDFEKKKIYLKYNTANTDLEAQADALLTPKK